MTQDGWRPKRKRITKLSKENIECFYDTEFGNGFLGIKYQKHGSRNNKSELDFIRIKHFLRIQGRNYNKKNEKAIQQIKETNYIFEKGLISMY